MRRYAFRRTALAAIALLVISAVVLGVLLASSSGFRSYLRERTDDGPYSFISPEPGGKYLIKFRKYKRYGPLLDEFNAMADKMLDPETAIQTITISLDSHSLPYDITIETRTESGELWYTKSSADGHSFTVTNHRTGEERIEVEKFAPPIPDPGQSGETPSMVDVLLESGFEIFGYGSFNTRETTILRSEPTPVSPGDLTLPSAGNYKSPIVYGLDAAQFVVEMHIDTEQGMVLRSLRYTIDSEGRETLIESFESLAMRDIS